jgi:Ricin-type beta-trefoil lectin domain
VARKSVKLSMTVAVALLGLVAGSIALPSAASAQGPYLMTDWQTGRCLHHVYDWWGQTSVCDNYQQFMWWDVSAVDGGTIVNWASHRCLDSDYNGRVYWLSCNGGRYQGWNHPGDGTVRNLQTGRCLDSDYNGNVYTLPCNGGGFQQWRFFLPHV